MYLEIEAAVKFFMKILSLKSTLTTDQLDSLGKNLACLLRDRYQGHWYPDKPAQGQAYRCIRINKWQYVDESLLQACKCCGIEYSRLPIPREITIWIDPFEVCGRIGETRDYFTIATFKPVYEEPWPVFPEQVHKEPVDVFPEQVHEEPVDVFPEPVAVFPERVLEEPVAVFPEQVHEEPVDVFPEPVLEEPVAVFPEQVHEEPVDVFPEWVLEEPVAVFPERVLEEPVAVVPERVLEEPVAVVPERVTEEPMPASPEWVTEELVTVYLECETSDYSSDGLSESEFVSENSSDEETGEDTEKVETVVTCTSPDEAIDSTSTSKAGTPVSELLVADQETDESVDQETT
ncbi:uncharacterized protein LOC143933767 [Lithobates pipiens]